MGAKQIPSRKHKKGKKPWEYPDYQGKQRRWGGKYLRQKKPLLVNEWSWSLPISEPPVPEVKTYTYTNFSDVELFKTVVPEEGIQQTIEFDTYYIDMTGLEIKTLAELTALQMAKEVDKQMMSYFTESDDKEGNSTTN